MELTQSRETILAWKDSLSASAPTARNSPAFFVGSKYSGKRCGIFSCGRAKPCGGMDLWEWKFGILISEAVSEGNEAPLCLAGRNASPPEFCGGPTDYRLILKRQ